jgi:putative ABC transport system permease protein
VSEIRYAARSLRRSPGFTVATLLTLSLAIGANVAIFAVVKSVVLNPLPYPDSSRLVELDHGAERLNIPSGMGLTPGLYYHYFERSRTLESIAIYQTDDATLSGNGEPERIQVARATPSLGPVLQMPPARGRWFNDQEGVPGAPQVAVLSHGLWTRRYGGDPAILGRVVTLNGTPTQVIGILPPSFAFLDARALAFLDGGVDMWLPAQITRSMGFGQFGYAGVARLRPGVTVAEARTELSSLLPDLTRAFPGDAYALGNAQTNLIPLVRTLHEALVGGITRALWTLLLSVALVLLVACANVANLFLVRTDARHHEIAVRYALGAGRGGIVRYFAAESVLLALTGGLAGVALAAGALRLVVRFGPRTLPRLAEIRLDAVAMTYALILSVIATALFGLIPLWGSRGRLSSMQANSRVTVNRTRHRTRRLLMGAQVATALLLLVSAGLMVKSFQRLRSLDPGFDPTSRLTFSIGLPDREYTNRAARVAAHQAMLDRLAALPGVVTASASSCLPLAGGCFGNTVRVRGRVTPPGTVPPVALFRAVAGGYFEAMGMPMLRGRGITRSDIDQRQPVVVIDDVFARQFFPDQNPLGEYIASNVPPARPGQPADLTWLEVIGVVPRTPTRGLVDSQPMPQLYMPISTASGPSPAVMSYVVRSETAVRTLLESVRHAVDAVDSRLAIAEVRTMQETLDRSSAQMAFTMVLLAIAAGVALLLGIIGVYGTTSYIVSQRTSEIGLRLAVGAEPATVTAMIVRQGGLVALGGVAIGVAGALLQSRFIAPMLYGVNARDANTYTATSILLLIVVIVACWLPARRAARVDPIAALRAE